MKNKKLCIGLVCILLFFLISLIVVVINGVIDPVDAAVYNVCATWINDTNTTIFKIITFFGSTIFIVLFVLFCWLFWKKGRRGNDILCFLVISTVINNLIKIIIQRPRPEILQLVTENSYSFPSGHTMAVTSLVGILLYFWWSSEKATIVKKVLVTLPLLVLIFLVMTSRVYLGVHYFSDTIGGFITSLALLLVYTTFISPLLHKNSGPSPTVQS
ncbi:MAG: phosphatase PAP2 family protein [Bacilli bacterium]|nr:phosphatase PAP2 family protein [Bacilli bacterium]